MRNAARKYTGGRVWRNECGFLKLEVSQAIKGQSISNVRLLDYGKKCEEPKHDIQVTCIKSPRETK